MGMVGVDGLRKGWGHRKDLCFLSSVVPSVTQDLCHCFLCVCYCVFFFFIISFFFFGRYPKTELEFLLTRLGKPSAKV